MKMDYRPARIAITALLAGLALSFHAGCTIKTEHKIEPIHITVDVNVKVERQLNDIFGSIDQASSILDFGELPASSATGDAATDK